MIRRVSSGRRLLRKKIYKSPHARHKHATFKRENKNLVKTHQKKFKDLESPNIRTKKRPKREVINGFKMSYRYRYYNNDIVEEIEESDDESD